MMKRRFLLYESWLSLHREELLPKPSADVNWKIAKGNVTEETMELLELLQPNFNDVSIFSWHPHIKTAQYSTHKSVGGDMTNYNRRIWIESSVIAKMAKKASPYEPSASSLTRSVLKHFPFMEYLGGSGTLEDGYGVSQSQVSFLTPGVQTHIEAKRIKEKKFTAGAYSFDGSQWKFVAVEDFYPYKRRIVKVGRIVGILMKIFEYMPQVKKILLSGPDLHPILHITRKDHKTIVIKIVDELQSGELVYKVMIAAVMMNAEGLEEMFKATLLFTDEECKKLGKNPENFAEILKDYRGRSASKRFGF